MNMTQHTGRVLLVEDDEDVRRIVSYSLGAIAEVIEARNGLEALGIIESGWVPDVVISDLMMPGMDGFALAGKLKHDPSLRAIPIVFLTAKGAPMDLVAGINAGARHYVTKPFKTDDLKKKVMRLLGRAAA